jgi:predicted DNA repair protein MutK
VLGFLAPWAITPLLMLGGIYLCFEGAEKVHEALWPHAGGHGTEPAALGDARQLEDQKVRGAIKTDFILSAEIMAITLAAVAMVSFWMQAFVLAAVGIGITAGVYGVVALIVKADDAGLMLAGSRWPPLRLLGRGLVRGMPVLLKGLGIVGTAAMLWVGGGIILHGLEGYGLAALPHAVHDAAEVVAHALPDGIAGAGAWLAGAALAGLFGLALGGVAILVVQRLATPLLARFRPSERAAVAPSPPRVG